jgi:hypothetical protein
MKNAAQSTRDAMYGVQIMDKIETWDVVIDPGIGFTSKVYHQWKADVLKVRDFPEYKLRKLYKAGYTAAQIDENKHWEQFPPTPDARQRKAARMGQSVRGRCLTDKRKNWIYARALRDAAEGMLKYYRTEIPFRELLKADVVRFKELMKIYDHKYRG